MLHDTLTSGTDKVSRLSRAREELITNTEGNTPRHTYCSRAMQLTFPAGYHFGFLTDHEEAKEECVKWERREAKEGLE